ncbi:coiled-coil domain-containing protein C16orf93 homolog isoform X1 [Poecilia latipinna]|uniref:coiled-coil domain-containing protein C16orf93 homolog isoform X1 n=2 Tax=Poecilia latipinna TaxID=48699 RepID=UPI00072D9C5D|nr:PREDICTED: coiled-coil domain-containing protein C16orf93 homolog isoform X1 [Poecilia latipinna]XP_014881259.1 PREDICTED: coiled-coil domain-containing protein C16orf93 homolog isoform X1 [Poecilia latipinna]
MDTSIKVPRDLTAKLLLWTDISFHDMEVIDQIQSVPDLESALCSVLAVDLPEPKKAVLLELYVQTVLFCRQQGFSKAQTSALVSIIKSIHEANIETPLNNSEQCFKYCNDLLLCHSVRRPPFSVKLFSLDEVNCVLNYIQDHYLRHDRLYKYIFTPQVKLDLFLTYSGKGGEGLAADESAEQGDDSSETEKTSAMEEETAEASVDLKALVEQEVKEQMEQVSKQLDQRIKETVSEQSSKAQSAKSGKKGKK